jgi:hypothetical protein
LKRFGILLVHDVEQFSLGPHVRRGLTAGIRRSRLRVSMTSLLYSDGLANVRKEDDTGRGEVATRWCKSTTRPAVAAHLPWCAEWCILPRPCPHRITYWEICGRGRKFSGNSFPNTANDLNHKSRQIAKRAFRILANCRILIGREQCACGQCHFSKPPGPASLLTTAQPSV